MLENLTNYFNTSTFMPHGYCFLWAPSLLWIDVVSDLTTAVSYLSIPFALWYFAQKRPGSRCSTYDPEVADACLKLFREKGYALPA